MPENRRLLIVGESHYLSTEDVEKSASKHSDAYITRRVVQELGIEGNAYGTNFFVPLHKGLFGTDDIDKEKFWHGVSFYNFIQKPMSSVSNRPTNQDFIDGWATFTEVHEILQPSHCLFIGNSAANYLEKALRNTNFNLERISWIEQIGRYYGKFARIKSPDGKLIDIHFIKHTSSYFSWALWHEYLKKQMPEIIEDISRRVFKS